MKSRFKTGSFPLSPRSTAVRNTSGAASASNGNSGASDAQVSHEASVRIPGRWPVRPLLQWHPPRGSHRHRAHQATRSCQRAPHEACSSAGGRDRIPNRTDGKRGMGTAERLQTQLRQPPVPDVASLHQLPNGSGDVFDRHLRVDALIEEIDGVRLHRFSIPSFRTCGSCSEHPFRCSTLRAFRACDGRCRREAAHAR